MQHFLTQWSLERSLTSLIVFSVVQPQATPPYISERIGVCESYFFPQKWKYDFDSSIKPRETNGILMYHISQNQYTLKSHATCHKPQVSQMKITWAEHRLTAFRIKLTQGCVEGY